MKNKNREHKLNINSIFFLLICLGLLTMTYSKYIDKKGQGTLYQADDFYFESSILSNSSQIPEYTFAKGTNSITIDLNNYIDELRYSEVSINYEVSIASSNGTIIDTKTGTLTKSNKRSATINFEGLQSGTYTVVAKSITPYSKTLRANFIISESENNIEYTVSDMVGSNVLHLTVSNNDYCGNVSISWPEGISPDSTDTKLSETNTGNNSGNATVNFEANSEYNFQFFKSNPNTKYTKEQFIVAISK